MVNFAGRMDHPIWRRRLAILLDQSWTQPLPCTAPGLAVVVLPVGPRAGTSSRSSVIRPDPVSGRVIVAGTGQDPNRKPHTAFESGDVDRIMSFYAPGSAIVACDILPPLQFDGWEAYRSEWVNSWRCSG